jgi:hypothetical protein
VTLTIYDTPQSYVRLEADRASTEGTGHSHPADISIEQMAAVLSGIAVQEPLTRVPLYDDLSIPRRHRAFSEKDVTFWAPLLSLALEKATPDEVVTFYQSVRLSAVNREVTSGGLHVEGDELHVTLSNLRSETQYAADIGVSDSQDDRLTPMRSIAPQRGKLLFFPESARADAGRDKRKGIFHWDQREVVILYKELSPRSLNPEAVPLPPQTPEMSPVNPVPAY